LKDHYLRFWFRFVHPNRSQLEQGGARVILENRLLPELDHFTSLAFEEICKQYFLQQALLEKLSFSPIAMGRWWNDKEEIDLMVMNDMEAMLVECKWSNQPVGTNILTALERKAASAKKDLGDRKIQFALCSRSGFTDQMMEVSKERQDVCLVDLKRIIEEK
jgi:hypothetical protein